MRCFLIGLLCFLVMRAAPAAAWPGVVHRAIMLRALDGTVEHGPLALPQPSEVFGFYRWLALTLAGASEPDHDGAARFRGHYPSEQSVDAMGVRVFLGLTTDPEVDVHGIGTFDRNRELDRFDALVFAAEKIHEDRRFRAPIRRDGAYAALRLADGSPLPDDPQTLHFGPLEGPASEDWARSALPTAVTTTEEAALASEPWRFVAPVCADVPVGGGAATMAQLHTDMALMAYVWASVEFKAAGEYISLVWLGAAMAVVLDAASPFATVQAGSPALWEAAGRAWRWDALRSGGGLWRPMASRAWHAVRIRHNLRVIGEHLIARAVEEAVDAEATDGPAAALLAAAAQDDAAFLALLQARGAPWLQLDNRPEPFADGEGTASLVVAGLAEAATADAARAYDLVAAIAAPRWLRSDALLDPAQLGASTLLGDATSAASQEAQRELLAIAARTLARGATGQRLLWRVWNRGHGRSSLGRLRQGGLRHLQARAVRSAGFVAGQLPPPGALGGEDRRWVGLVELALGGGLLTGGALLLWRRRRRPRSK